MRGQVKRAHVYNGISGRPLPPRRARVRRGFSLLEILVVIGIIMLLVAIAVISFGALNPSGRGTKMTLANLQGMFAAYQAQAGLREQPQVVYINNQARPTTGNDPASLWAHVSVIPDSPAGIERLTSGSPGRYQLDGVANAQRVFAFLNRIPANKQAMSALPSKQVLGVIEVPRPNKLTGPNPRQVDPPLVLDAWGNPIIFVGSGGLSGVRFEAQKASPTAVPPKKKVTSVGIIGETETTPQSARPFFASAGPDGDIETGDDNMYSFEN